MSLTLETQKVALRGAQTPALQCTEVADGVFFAPLTKKIVASRNALRIIAQSLESMGFAAIPEAKYRKKDDPRFREPAIWILNAQTVETARETLSRYAQTRFDAEPVDYSQSHPIIRVPQQVLPLITGNRRLQAMSRIAFGTPDKSTTSRRFGVQVKK